MVTKTEEAQLDTLRSKWIGKKVKIHIVDTYGKSTVAQNDTGVVVDVQSTIPVVCLVVDINPVSGYSGLKGWLCNDTDVEVIDEKVEEDKMLMVKANKYITFLGGRLKGVEDSKREVLEDIQRTEEHIYQLNDKLVNLNRLLDSSFRSIGRIPKADIVDKLRIVYSKYEDVYIENTKIIGNTKPIVMRYDGMDIELGTYQVTVDFIKGLSFRSLIRVYKVNESVSDIHPHITSSGTPCLGTWQNTFSNHQKSGAYLDMLLLAYQFLSECDKNGWYVSAYAFAKDNADRCTGCWELEDNCECDKCSHCGYHTENCECPTCPSTGDLLDEGGHYCSECSHRSGDGECNY